MDDREMLEWAAKAAGYVPVGVTDDETALLLEGIQKPWNPRDENPHSDCMGDALRLAVDVGLNVYPSARTSTGQACSAVGTGSHGRLSEVVDPNNAHAATRLAILRAAAEIGKAMLQKEVGK